MLSKFVLLCTTIAFVTGNFRQFFKICSFNPYLSFPIALPIGNDDNDSTGIVVRSGHSAVVACNAPELTENQYLYWNLLDRDTNDVKEVLYWSKKELTSEKYIINNDGYNLEIKEVTMGDSAWYECYVVNVETNQRVSSRRTFLSVIDAPECSSSQLTGQPGDLVTLSCNPRVRQHDGANDVAVRWSSQLSPEFTSNEAEIHVNLSESMNDAVFKCTTELAGVSTTCVLDPFDVKFPPQPPSIFIAGGHEVSPRFFFFLQFYNFNFEI